MSTRIQGMVPRSNQIPFKVLPNRDDDKEFHPMTFKRESRRPRNAIDRFVSNLRRSRRFKDYKHRRLNTSDSVESLSSSSRVSQRTTRSSSIEKITDYASEDKPPSQAFMGRRRSRSDTDLLATSDMFLMTRRRAAICEEMERSIFMQDGNTLRKCRKNLVIQQILENLSLL